MRLEFTYTAADLAETQAAAQAQAYAKQRATGVPKRLRVFGWIFFIGLAAVMFILLQNRTTPRAPASPLSPAPPGAAALQWMLPFVPWLLIFGFIWFFVFRQMNASNQVLAKYAEALQPKAMDVTDDGVTLSDPLTSTNWRWDAFKKHVETKNLLLLGDSTDTFVMIPKRALSEAQLDALRQWVAAKIHEPGAFPVLPVPSADRGGDVDGGGR